jgi:plasmid maintenance system killer protein
VKRLNKEITFALNIFRIRLNKHWSFIFNFNREIKI